MKQLRAAKLSLHAIQAKLAEQDVAVSTFVNALAAEARTMRICAQWAFALVFAPICFATTAKAEDIQKLNTLCKKEGGELLAVEANDPNAKLSDIRTHFSFSTTIDECVETRIDYLTNQWAILDVNGTFYEAVRPGAAELFSCDKHGVNNVLLDAARRLNASDITLRNYSQWLDDGEGGPPAVLKNGEGAPYSLDKCEELFKRKLAELRLVDEPKW
jgi:hypothetical protein